MMGKSLRWRARRDSNPRPSASKPFDLLCQILPEEWLIERIQRVGATSRKLLSPSFVAICFTIAGVFRALRYIFVTGRRADFDRHVDNSSFQIPCAGCGGW